MKKIYMLLMLSLFCYLQVKSQVNSLTESFDTDSLAGWTAINLSNPLGTSNWTSGVAIPNLAGYTGAGCAIVNFNSTTGAGNISNWYISPQVNLRDGGVIKFYTRTVAGTTVYPDRLQVRLSTSGASTNVGTSDSDVGDFTILACDINPTLSSSSTSTGGCGNPYPQTWTLYTITVTGVGSTPVAGRIAFRYFVTNGGPSGTNSNLIGLDEFSYQSDNCSGMPSAGTAFGPAAACDNTNFTLTLTGASAATGISVQWQRSPVGANNWINIPGAVSTTATVSQTSPMDYRAVVTCTNPGGLSANSNTVTVAQSFANCPPSCTSVSSPANGATNVSYPNLTLSWNASAGATSYDIYFDIAATPSLALSAYTGGTSISATGLFPATTYYWYVVPRNANGTLANCTTAYSFTTQAALPAPPNDDCINAVSLSPYNGTMNGTTLSATASGDTSCSNGTANDDVWYKITALQNGDAVITVIGAGTFDAVVQAYTGACGFLTPISGACQDTSFTGDREQLTLTGLVAGQTYYIRVYDWEAGQGDNFTISASGVALPVNFVRFNGQRDGKIARLNWTTATEINNAGFELQRSADGRSFSQLAYIPTKANNGNSSSTLTYNYNDVKPLMGNGYYRLKQIDKDGKFNYSNIVLIKGAKVSAVTLSSIYPNPVKNNLSVVLSSPTAERINLVITDLSGKVISNTAANIVIGDNNIQIPVASLAAGSYIIKAVCSNGCETAVQKFVKQ